MEVPLLPGFTVALVVCHQDIGGQVFTFQLPAAVGQGGCIGMLQGLDLLPGRGMGQQHDEAPGRCLESWVAAVNRTGHSQRQHDRLFC